MRGISRTIVLSFLWAILLPALAAASPTKPQAGFASLGHGVDDIVLHDGAGANVSWNAFTGKPRLLFFGFTHCPVVCPVTVWELDSALLELGPQAQDLKITFVTLDPARDTSAVLSKYFSGFKGRVIPLTGTGPDIAKIARAFDITFEKVATGKGEYTIDHTASVFLINGKGQVTDSLAFGTPRDVTLKRLRNLLAKAK